MMLVDTEGFQRRDVNTTTIKMVKGMFAGAIRSRVLKIQLQY
jgi:hypothetical protein